MAMFDVMGPIMIEPSSSHTAGAVKSSYLAARLWQARQKSSHLTPQFVCRDRAGRFDVRQMVLILEAQREFFKPVLGASGS
ncbi:MAG: hypothetical protein NT102_00455 [Caldiserica bacterium]|nr:hypothetical protein [Caldisericota bacterium]